MRPGIRLAILVSAISLGPWIDPSLPQTTFDYAPITGDAATALRGGFVALVGTDELGQTITRLFEQNLVSYPPSTSSPAFSYSFDPTIGLQVRNSRSFGPMLIERPFTSGRGRWDLSFSHQRTGWRSISGLNLAGGELVQDWLYPGRQSSSSTLQLEISTAVSTLGFTIGVSDRVDVSVVVPVVTVNVDGEWRNDWECLPAGYEQCGAPARDFSRARIAGHSSGVADAVIQTKFGIGRSAHSQLAVVGGIRVPTGDANALLGSGRVQPTVSLLAAGGSGNFSGHARMGFTYAGGGVSFSGHSTFGPESKISPSSEFGYGGGVDAAVNSRFTVSGDILGRAVLNTIPLMVIVDPIACPASAPPDCQATLRRITLDDRRGLRTTHLFAGVAGIKVEIAKQLLLIADVVLPLSDAGLKPGVTPLVGLERAF